MESIRRRVAAGVWLPVVLAACAPDLTDLGNTLAEGLFCSSSGCSDAWESGTPDVIVTGHVFVGDEPVAAGGAVILLATVDGYPAPPPLGTYDGGEYSFSANGEVGATVCRWSASARLADGRTSPIVPLFDEPPSPCSGEFAAADFRFDP